MELIWPCCFLKFFLQPWDFFLVVSLHFKQIWLYLPTFWLPIGTSHKTWFSLLGEPVIGFPHHSDLPTSYVLLPTSLFHCWIRERRRKANKPVCNQQPNLSWVSPLCTDVTPLVRYQEVLLKVAVFFLPIIGGRRHCFTCLFFIFILFIYQI